MPQFVHQYLTGDIDRLVKPTEGVGDAKERSEADPTGERVMAIVKSDAEERFRGDLKLRWHPKDAPNGRDSRIVVERG